MTESAPLVSIERILVESALSAGFLLLYVYWSRVYFQVVDPWLRRRLGSALGAEVRWVFRRGSHGEGDWSFGPLYSTWSWGTADPARGRLRDAAAYGLWLLLVMILAGMWPIALFLVLFLAAGLPSAWVGIPTLLLMLPIYTWSWARHAPDHEGRGSRAG